MLYYKHKETDRQIETDRESERELGERDRQTERDRDRETHTQRNITSDCIAEKNTDDFLRVLRVLPVMQLGVSPACLVF